MALEMVFNPSNCIFAHRNFDFKILPNPNNGIFAIATDEENMDEIITYDFQGREVKHIKNDKIGDTCIIDISNESNGIYVIKVINKKGSSTKKFIKIFRRNF
ncbi:MAG: T9SS type A sorting domain-containing protein [Bacteroidales bacterium]|nr:T9SS type A sorting domain-containing protein [Bacteroidales bacterium]